LDAIVSWGTLKYGRPRFFMERQRLSFALNRCLPYFPSVLALRPVQSPARLFRIVVKFSVGSCRPLPTVSGTANSILDHVKPITRTPGLGVWVRGTTASFQVGLYSGTPRLFPRKIIGKVFFRTVGATAHIFSTRPAQFKKPVGKAKMGLRAAGADFAGFVGPRAVAMVFKLCFAAFLSSAPAAGPCFSADEDGENRASAIRKSFDSSAQGGDFWATQFVFSPAGDPPKSAIGRGENAGKSRGRAPLSPSLGGHAFRVFFPFLISDSWTSLVAFRLLFTAEQEKKTVSIHSNTITVSILGETLGGKARRQPPNKPKRPQVNALKQIRIRALTELRTTSN